MKMEYAFKLKSGEIVKAFTTWVRDTDGDIKTIEHTFFWEGRTYSIGVFSGYQMALDYISQNPKGVWVTPNFGSRGGRWIPFEDILEVIEV